MSDRGNSLLRLGDRYIGIPLVFLLGLFKKRKQQPREFTKVGILATAAIGDTLLISPVIKDFIKRYPNTDIVIYCGKTNREIFEMVLPTIKIITLPMGNPFKSIKIIKRMYFDLFFDFGPWPRINSLLSFFANAEYSVGFNSIKQYRHYVYNGVVSHLNTCHEIDNLRRLVSDFDIDSKSVPTLGKHTPDKTNSYVVVHMFPSGFKAYYKEWSDQKWITLINGLTEKNIMVYLTGAPKDIGVSERIYNKCINTDNIILLAGKTNIKDVGNILQKAALVVSVNTGIMHMAAAYNLPVIALHGPTSSLRWGPICDKKVNFEATTIGAGCLHLGFEYIKEDSMSLDSIDAKSVLHKVITLLKVTNEHRL